MVTMRRVRRYEPNIYRAIIDDVITSMKPEFDEYGVSEDILAELQNVRRVVPYNLSALLTTNVHIEMAN